MMQLFALSAFLLWFIGTSVNGAVCAGSQKYTVTFEATWTLRANDPTNGHFSPFIAASHSSAYKPFAVNTLASKGVKNIAETGNTTEMMLEMQAQQQAGNVLNIATAGMIAKNTGFTTLEIVVNTTHPYITILGMIAPSPDWFTGFSMDMCVGANTWSPTTWRNANAYDAGTDSGETFTAANSPTNPPANITRNNTLMPANFGGFFIGQTDATMCSGKKEYTVTMWGNWNGMSHPTGYPANAHWSPLVAVASSATFKLFMMGSMATPGVVQVAEMGNTTTLVSELRAKRMAGSVVSYMVASGGTPRGTGFMTVKVVVDSAHPYISTISMIAPSSDFFTGISGQNMCGSNGQWVKEWGSAPLAPYDAGSRSNNNFSLGGPKEMPQKNIAKISCGKVFCTGTGAVPSLGNVTMSCVVPATTPMPVSSTSVASTTTSKCASTVCPSNSVTSNRVGIAYTITFQSSVTCADTGVNDCTSNLFTFITSLKLPTGISCFSLQCNAARRRLSAGSLKSITLNLKVTETDKAKALAAVQNMINRVSARTWMANVTKLPSVTQVGGTVTCSSPCPVDNAGLTTLKTTLTTKNNNDKPPAASMGARTASGMFIRVLGLVSVVMMFG